MRNLVSAAAVLTVLALPVQAQLNLNVVTKEPITGLDSETWANMEKRFVNAKPIIGKPEVYMINATPDAIVTVNCQSWQLVGNKPYIKDNPDTLPPFTVTMVPAQGFDGYCKAGVRGLTATGDTYKGSLNSSNQSFSDSTFITFSPKSKE